MVFLICNNIFVNVIQSEKIKIASMSFTLHTSVRLARQWHQHAKTEFFLGGAQDRRERGGLWWCFLIFTEKKCHFFLIFDISHQKSQDKVRENPF